MCLFLVCGSGGGGCVCVCVARHKSNTYFNVVTVSIVMATGPMVLHARTSVNVSLGQ